MPCASVLQGILLVPYVRLLSNGINTKHMTFQLKSCLRAPVAHVLVFRQLQLLLSPSSLLLLIFILIQQLRIFASESCCVIFASHIYCASQEWFPKSLISLFQTNNPTMFLTRIVRAADHPYLFGKGGRLLNNQTPQGLTVASLKHHTALQPLFAIMTVGIIFVGAYIGRYTRTLAFSCLALSYSCSLDLPPRPLMLTGASRRMLLRL